MKRLINFLKRKGAKYEEVSHRKVYTAFDKAKTLKVSEGAVGKTLVLRLDKGLGLVLIGANRLLDTGKFKKIAKVKKVEFASERLIKNRLKGAKVGAVPPFGVLWKLPTFIDKSILRQKNVILAAGGYKSSIKILPKQLTKLLPEAIFGNFSKKRQ